MISRAAPLALLAAGLLAIGLIKPGEAWAAPGCRQGEVARVWTAPLRPLPGEPLQVLAVATDGALDEIRVTAPGRRALRLPTSPGGGPPWNLLGTLDAPEEGIHRVEVLRGGQVLACTEAPVGGGAGDRGSGRWDLAAQAFYAAWVERLFDAPPDESLSFPSLAPVLADPARNFLHGYLGAGEDERLPAEPDCADLSYFLRAYFAWKLGLPSRTAPAAAAPATARRAARADDRAAFAGLAASAATFRGVSRRIMDTITPAADASRCATRRPTSTPCRSIAPRSGRGPSTPTPTATPW